MPLGLGLTYRGLKFCSRKYLEQLIQDAAKSLHGADSSSLISKLGRFEDRIQRVSPFSGLSSFLIWTAQPGQEG
jgi:hypothetical protein